MIRGNLDQLDWHNEGSWKKKEGENMKIVGFVGSAKDFKTYLKGIKNAALVAATTKSSL